MRLKENVGLAKVSKDDQGVVNPTYASAIRDIEKAEKKKEETTKVQDTPKHDEKPKNPKMVSGAKKMHLDESLFEDVTENSIPAMTKEEVLQNAETIFNQLQDTNNILISSWRPFDTLEAFGYAHEIRKGNDNHSGEEILRWRNYGSSAEDNTLEKFRWLLEEIFDKDKYFAVLPIKEFYAKQEEFYDQESTKRQAELDDINEARVGKTKEIKVLQGNYGYGWDDLVEYDVADFNGDLLAMNREIRQDLKDYRENETNASHRVVTRRVARELKEDKELDKEVSAIRRDMTKVGMPPKKSREEHKKFLSKLRDKRKEIKESTEPNVAGFVQEIKQVLKPEEIDTHESDLYVRVSPEARRLLRKYNMLNNPMLSTFVDEIDHDRWYDIPFGNLDNQLSLTESNSLKEMSRYGMQTQFDKRKSFYNKADVDVDDETGEKTLYSYNTPVAKITKDKKVTLLPKWDLSATTLRHVKEFLKQNGLVADSLKQIRRDYI